MILPSHVGLILGIVGNSIGPTPAQNASLRRFIADRYPAKVVIGDGHVETFAAHAAAAVGVPVDVYPTDIGFTPFRSFPARRMTVYDELPIGVRDMILMRRVDELLHVPRNDGDPCWLILRAVRAGMPVHTIRQDGSIWRFPDG
jgi:hypothetical protein